VLVTAVFFAAVTLAQGDTGQITGRITDPNGAAIPGATVTIKAVDTGATRSVTTDQGGFYNAAYLQPGVYEITVQATGFAEGTQRAVISIGNITRLNKELSVTPVTGQTEIHEGSGGVTVNSQNQQLSNPISGRQIRELPTVSRNPFDLVTLSGNVTPVNVRNGVNAQGTSTVTSRAINYSINGQHPAGNNLQLDGGEMPSSYLIDRAQQLPLDAVQEIQVVTNNYLPSFGRAIGGVINYATRQGTNDLHGSLFEFHRNSSLSTNSFANNAFGVPEGHLVANQFGYSIGGPIRRDRLFFFHSTEGHIVRSREDRLALVPTANLLGVSALATRNFFNAFPLGAVTVNNTLTAGAVRNLIGLGTVAGNAFAALPAALPAFNLVQFPSWTDMGAGLPQDSLLTTGRVDWQVSDRSQVYARYAFEHRDLFAGTNSFSPFLGFDAGEAQRNHGAVINYSSELSPKWGFSTIVSFSRLNSIRPLGAQPAVPRLLLTGSGLSSIGNLAVALPGFQPFNPGFNLAFSGPENLMNINQDFRTSYLTHQFTMGGSYFYTQDNRSFGQFTNAAIALGAGLPQALSNLVLGQASTFQTAINTGGLLPGQTIGLPVAQPSFSGSSNSTHDFALYFNDSWRAHPRINFNIGLRYDYFGRVRSRTGQLQSGFFTGAGTNIFQQIQSGTVSTAQNAPNNVLFKPDEYNIAPRLGFAIALTGDGRTSLRGGYGITYERPASNPAFSLANSLTSIGVVSLTANAGGVGTIPITTSNFGPLSGTTGTTVLPTTFAAGFLRNNFQTAHVHFWNLSLERELLPNTVGSIQYAGAAGRDLYALSNINRLGSGAAFNFGFPSTARLNSQFGSTFFFNNGGRSNYHALIAELANSTWRSIGLQFSARYRYSRSMDNLNGIVNNGFAGFLDPFNPGLDYGPSDFDIKHRFIGSFNWEVPFDRLGGTGWVKQALGGWQVTGIAQVRSGTPFTVVNCANAASAESPCPRAVVVGDVGGDIGDDSVFDTTIANRFNVLGASNFVLGSFTNVPTGSSDFGPFPAGTIGRNFFRGPGFWNLDAGIHKRFRLTEQAGLQFRAEFFNLFNHANLFVPNNVDISSTNFVSAFRDGRRHVQLALRLTF
jgi:hypothetical protein